jgi:deazaflavin-dependent oxidoreductase (nitroreductase family)
MRLMNPLTPLAIVIGRQKWMPKLLPVIVALDKFLVRVSRGRFPLLRVAGLPELFLTVKGRKSGVARTTPLLYVPHGDEFLIAGSNWGGPSLPVWVLNLRASWTAEVQVRGRSKQVTAREAEGAEREQLWALMLKTWPNYAHYAERTDRTIPVFVLTPA